MSKIEEECREYMRKALGREPEAAEVAWAVKVARRADAHWRKVIADKIAAGDVVKTA